ncbi:transposase [Zoogloea oleivorans]|uniref:Transposase n=1 Tax=Zoogloea oleivorans TaxID=1552750 RepID=A0A6C2CBM1_9RHOO|nr:IS3 family transposase [Zoogloea oleivorans]TYC51384.1 transposase [Zoogloea oleivorans]
MQHPGKGYGLVRHNERCGFVELFELVMANQADFPRTQCRVFQVSPSFYAWYERQPIRRAIGNAALIEWTRTIHADSYGTYGRARVHAELIDQGVKVSSKRVPDASGRTARCEPATTGLCHHHTAG